MAAARRVYAPVDTHLQHLCWPQAYAGQQAQCAVRAHRGDWSLKAADSSEGPHEHLLAWRFKAGELAKNLLLEGIRAMKIWPMDGLGLGTSLRPELFQRPDATVHVTRG